MFKIYKGGEYFYQWDIGQRLLIEDETIKKVHFCNRTGDCALACSVYEEDGLRLVNVPNILLQSTNNIRVYGCVEEGEEICFAKEMQIFRVITRNKPEEYVYTENELKNWDSLDNRLILIEEDITKIEALGYGELATQTDVAAVNTRLDNIIAETTLDSDTELLDIRVGADGTQYESAGAAVRAKVNKTDIVSTTGVSEDKVMSQKIVTEKFNALTKNEYPQYNNIIDWEKINHKKFHQGNSASDNNGYWNTGYCKVEANTSYISWESGKEVYIPIVNFYNENKECINYITNTKGFTTPDNCAYVILAFRYVHAGVMGTYTDVEGWDDYINKIIVNISTNGNITAPYDDYLAEDIKIKRKVSIESKVIYIEDGKRETAQVGINRDMFSGEVEICVCGSNIFDGVMESGYYSASGKLNDANNKRSVNPIYVNENDYITFAKNCRVTEYDEEGTYIISDLATARIPYKTSHRTSYIHIHGAIVDMDAMYINIGKRLIETAEAYKKTTITETVRNWGTTIYNVDVPLFDGVNTIFVKSPIYTNITLTYNPKADNDREKIEDLYTKINDINYMRGTKIAASDKFVAHRGGSDVPENTYLAYVTAFLNGFKGIESDVRFTSDNVPLMLHDATIDRTSNGTGAIADMTAEEVQSYDFGSWKHKKFKGLQIPTFKNFIRFCWQFDIVPYIDIGGISHLMTAEQVQILYDIVAYYGMQEKAVWCCGNFIPVGHLNTIYNETEYKLNFAYITNSEMGADGIESVISSLDWFKNTSTHNLGDVYVSMSYETITAEYEQTIKSKNLKLTAYIVNNVKTARELSGYRIDSIATDNLDLPIAICSNIAQIDWFI